DTITSCSRFDQSVRLANVGVRAGAFVAAIAAGTSAAMQRHMLHSVTRRAALCSFVLLASASACATVDDGDGDSSAPLACDPIPVEGGVDDWRAAVQDAVAVWNAVPFNLVRMTYVTTSSADITFRSDAFQLPDNTAADSAFPASGNPGANVRVNLDFTFNNQT